MSVILSYFPKWTILVQAALLLIIPILILKCSHWVISAVEAKPPDQPDETSESGLEDTEENTDMTGIQLTGQYDTDLAVIRETLGKNSDVQIREFTIRNTGTRTAIIYVNGLVDSDLMDTHLITPLMVTGVPEEERESFLHSGHSMNTYLKNQLLPVSEMIETQSLEELSQAVLFGKKGLIVDGMPGGILVGSAEGKSRNIEEPLSEALLRGPRVGFTESLSDNTGLLRMSGTNQSLLLTQYEVGSRVKKNLVVAYMKDIADPKLVAEVDERIRRISIDDPLESGYIEQLIEDNVLSPFQQAQNTERPDRVISGLLEGRVAILLDGSPFALIVPVTFSMLLQSPEDYYERWIPGTFVRLLRFLAALIALLAPALYISFISFHPGLIPTKLAVTIIETRQGVPFPSIIEALIMEVAIEILREAGIRLPKPIGPAMGIVGGLIIGDAAVQAGIVSPFLVIVVAVTAISSFSIPVYSAGITLRILRFAGMFSAAVFGLFGVVMFFLFLCSHLVRLNSFGVPYTSPMVPYDIKDWKDFIVRMPLKVMRQRPSMMKPRDKDRTK